MSWICGIASHVGMKGEDFMDMHLKKQEVDFSLALKNYYDICVKYHQERNRYFDDPRHDYLRYFNILGAISSTLILLGVSISQVDEIEKEAIAFVELQFNESQEQGA